MNPDGTPHKSNTRSKLENNDGNWYGFEQEYTLTLGGRPLGFPKDGYPAPQGKYYCSVGAGLVAGRELVEEHLDLCLNAGLTLTGINAEVLLGQWEFQVLGKGNLDACDQLWLARYFLLRLSEQYGYSIEFHPKPLLGDWNGSGLHTNFSTEEMREKGGKELLIKYSLLLVKIILIILQIMVLQMSKDSPDCMRHNQLINLVTVFLIEVHPLESLFKPKKLDWIFRR